MTAASRALGALVVAAAVLLLAPSPAPAQSVEPMCPAEVGDLPLSVTTAFSGTVRHVAGGPSSLLCAYGEGVEPSAEVRVTWSAGCGEATPAVAPSLRAQPFEQAADDLAAGVGGACPPAAAGAPVVPLAAGAGAVTALAAAVLVVQRRRRRSPRRSGTGSATPAPDPRPQAERPVTDDRGPDHPPVVPGPARQPAASEGPVAHEAGPEPVRAPSLEPVLALLETPRGRRFARSAAGQWAMVSAVAYGGRDPASGDLARAGAVSSLAARRPPRPELADLAGRLAHQGEAGGR